MSKVSINGYGDSLTVNGICIGELSPGDHEAIEKEKGGQNYKPLEDVVVSHVKDSSTLIWFPITKGFTWRLRPGLILLRPFNVPPFETTSNFSYKLILSIFFFLINKKNIPKNKDMIRV